MSASEERWSVSADWVFNKTQYQISADVREDILLVQVEDALTTEQWTGRFDSKHIEELTRKTGNFKQFPIFLNMLESAITKSSDCVTIDLLTYADLESLRNKTQGRGTSPSSKTTQNKRYLILTYSVEFDRIHYPLALPHSGQADPSRLQQTIRRLQAELERAKRSTHRSSELVELKREYEALAREKQQLEDTLEGLKQDMGRVGSGSKESRFMKKVIRNLEEELLKERTKHQKYVSKKNEEFKNLLQELEELRLSERSLRTRVKSLSNELSVLKHGLRTTPSAFAKRQQTNQPRRSTSTERRPRRSTSTERRPTLSGDRSRGSLNRRASNERRTMRTPSPSGVRVPRFDPTAYVESRKKKQRDNDIKLGRVKVSVRARPPRSSERPARLSTSRTSSRGSSRRSSISSIQSNLSDQGLKPQSRRKVWPSPRLTTPTSSKKPSRNSSLLDQSAEISEIDARLTALQEFMKRSLETTRGHTHR